MDGEVLRTVPTLVCEHKESEFPLQYLSYHVKIRIMKFLVQYLSYHVKIWIVTMLWHTTLEFHRTPVKGGECLASYCAYIIGNVTMAFLLVYSPSLLELPIYSSFVTCGNPNYCCDFQQCGPNWFYRKSVMFKVQKQALDKNRWGKNKIQRCKYLFDLSSTLNLVQRKALWV